MTRLYLNGQRFGRLVVVSKYYGHTSGHGSAWSCQCDCGNITVVRGDVLRKSLGTRSCGCLARETTRALKKTHGMEKTRTYKSWSSMIERCDNENAPNYHRYGGRGITVCDRWRKFEDFFSDMGERPPDTTIGRKDNDGNYCLENCSWQTPLEQQRNKRNTKLTIEKARKIRSLFKSGIRKYLIARHVGVSFSNVKDVIDNRCWRE